MSIFCQIISGITIFITLSLILIFIVYLFEKSSSNDVRGGFISRFFLRRLIKRLSNDVQCLSWYIGVEKNEDTVIHDKYDRNSDLLIKLKYLIKNGL